MSNLLQAICAEPWAIEKPMLEMILSIAQRAHDPSILQAREGARLRNARGVTLRDGVAIVPITGPIFHRANLFTEISGATSNEILARDFTVAVEDPKTKAILLEIDSPGGQVAGTSELSNMIYAGREQKPVYAYVSARGASGGYWLASSAERVYLDSTAIVGSIGVVMAVNSGRQKGEIEFVSSNAPNKRIDAETIEGQQQIQALVDRLESEFIGAVARNRGISADDVLRDFGQGGVFVGADAVAAGMADSVGSFESVLAGLTAPNRSSVFMTTAQSKAGDQPAITLDLIKSQYPDIANSLRREGEQSAVSAVDDLVKDAKAEAEASAAKKADSDKAKAIAEAKAEGAQAERERIQGIYEHGKGIHGHDDMIEAMMFDGKTSVEAAGLGLFKAIKAEREEFAAKYHADAPKPAPTTKDVPIESTADFDDLPVEERCKAKWERDVNIRNEFSSLATYTAYVRATEAGRVRVLKSA